MELLELTDRLSYKLKKKLDKSLKYKLDVLVVDELELKHLKKFRDILINKFIDELRFNTSLYGTD